MGENVIQIKIGVLLHVDVNVKIRRKKIDTKRLYVESKYMYLSKW